MNIELRKTKPHASKYLGVSKRRLKWGAAIQVNGKQRYLGVFDTEREAAERYNYWAKRLGLEKLNEL